MELLLLTIGAYAIIAATIIGALAIYLTRHIPNPQPKSVDSLLNVNDAPDVKDIS